MRKEMADRASREMMPMMILLMGLWANMDGMVLVGWV
jgi:hypothetical protein